VVDEGDDPQTSIPDRAPPRRERELVGPISVGVGVAAAVAGVAMIGVGAPLGRRAERAQTAAFEDPRYLALDPEDPATVEYVDGYADYVRHERRRTRALVAVGSVLVAAGVGVAIYGVVRLVRHRRGGDETARVRAIPGGFAF
jgi:hypothetical protein